MFDLGLEPINGIRELLEQIIVPVAVVSNGPVSKMEHSLGLTSLRPFFTSRLFSGYTIGRRKPDPALIHHAAAAMSLPPMERCILIEDSLAGAQAGIPVFYYCADPHNSPLDHPLRRDGAIAGLMARARLDPDALAGAFAVAAAQKSAEKVKQSRVAAGGASDAPPPGNQWRQVDKRAAQRIRDRGLFRRGRVIRLTGQQTFQRVTAEMAEILTFDKIENKLTDILATIANTFDGARAKQCGQYARNGAGIFHQVIN